MSNSNNYEAEREIAEQELAEELKELVLNAKYYGTTDDDLLVMLNDAIDEANEEYKRTIEEEVLLDDIYDAIENDILDYEVVGKTCYLVGRRVGGIGENIELEQFLPQFVDLVESFCKNVGENSRKTSENLCNSAIDTVLGELEKELGLGLRKK